MSIGKLITYINNLKGAKSFIPTVLFTVLLLSLLFLWKDVEGIRVSKPYDSSKVEFYYIKSDQDIAEYFGKEMDINSDFDSIMNYFDYVPKSLIKVRIYNTSDDYNEMIDPIVNRWADSYILPSTSEFGDIRVLSPSEDKDDKYTRKEAYKYVKHSFVHHIMNRKYTRFDKMPMWMTEGMAVYLTTEDSEIKEIKDFVAKNDPPSFRLMSISHNRSEIRNQFNDTFTENNGRIFAYTMIDFIIKDYGYEVLMNMFDKANDYDGNYLDALEMENEEELQQEWKSYIERNYK